MGFDHILNAFLIIYSKELTPSSYRVIVATIPGRTAIVVRPL